MSESERLVGAQDSLKVYTGSDNDSSSGGTRFSPPYDRYIDVCLLY
jgi:hypothetical protein